MRHIKRSCGVGFWRALFDLWCGPFGLCPRCSQAIRRRTFARHGVIITDGYHVVLDVHL